MKQENARTLAGVNIRRSLLNKIKNTKIKEEKGSITLFTLIACLFLIIILLLVNVGLINKNTNQEKQLAQISKIYSVDETDMENAYVEAVDENGYITSDKIK